MLFTLAPSCRSLTAFEWHGQRYMFKAGFFGVSFIPLMFHGFLSSQLAPCAAFAQHFIDDILIFSTTYEEHVQHVAQVLTILTDLNLRIQPAKSHFDQRRFARFGRISDPDHGLSLDPLQVQSTVAWPRPTSTKDLERFLGHVNWLRDHLRFAPELTAPLNALKSASGSFVWTTEHTSAFDAIKQAVASSLLVAYPDWNLPLTLATDASNVGIGAVLYQLHPRHGRQVICLTSRSLAPYERNYSVLKKELLAIVFALRKFHDFLHGRHFTLHTDHRALCFLFTQPRLSTIVNNWADILFDYDFEVCHVPGYKNVTPDALSRIYSGKVWGSEEPLLQHQIVSTAPRIAMTLLDIAHVAQRTEPPEEERPQLVSDAHAFGHFGTEATFNRLLTMGYYWSSMRQDCKKSSESCPECLQYNQVRSTFHPLRSPIASCPFDHIGIDTLSNLPRTPRGHTAILVITDYFTRFVLLRPLRTKTMESIAATLWSHFCDFGVPKIIQSDNGTEFVNRCIKAMTSTFSIDHRCVAAYDPKANGMAERSNRTILSALRKLLLGRRDNWDAHLPFVQLSMNTRISTVTGATPFSLMFAREVNVFQNYQDAVKEKSATALANWNQRLEELTALIYPKVRDKSTKKQQKMREQFMRTHQIRQDNLAPGTLVMVLDTTRSNKLDPFYLGPYTVANCTPAGTYQLKDAKGRLEPRLYPLNHLKVVEHRFMNPEEVFDVDKVIAHKVENGNHGRRNRTSDHIGFLFHLWSGVTKIYLISFASAL